VAAVHYTSVRTAPQLVLEGRRGTQRGSMAQCTRTYSHLHRVAAARQHARRCCIPPSPRENHRVAAHEAEVTLRHVRSHQVGLASAAASMRAHDTMFDGTWNHGGHGEH
jgi:hypothetical protein